MELKCPANKNHKRFYRTRIVRQGIEVDNRCNLLDIQNNCVEEIHLEYVFECMECARIAIVNDVVKRTTIQIKTTTLQKFEKGK